MNIEYDNCYHLTESEALGVFMGHETQRENDLSNMLPLLTSPGLRPVLAHR